LTFFTIYDEKEPKPIKDAKGKCISFCVGADLSSSNENINEMDSKETDKTHDKTFDIIELDSDKPPSKLKKAFFWICGIEKMLQNKTEENLQDKSTNIVDTSIDEEPFWALICNINAVLAIALCGFCVAFFNKYD